MPLALMVVIGVGVLALLAGLMWWLLIATEGVYLGRGVVAWLYDVVAARYDRIKDNQPEFERHLVARPLLAIIDPQRAPMILDVATGTGRLPLALLREPDFQGRIVALDLSRAMLHVAAETLAEDANRVDLLHADATRLPFPDAAFDVVTCLEALEFTPDPRHTLSELARVLRPGGLLLTTRRVRAPWMPGHLWDEPTFQRHLAALGFDGMISERWQRDYDKVWAGKAGNAYAVGARALCELLRCPRCAHVAFAPHGPALHCARCNLRIRYAADGVLELHQT